MITLNKRLTLRTPVTITEDSLEKTNYVDGATVWASVIPLRGKEFWQAQQTQSESRIKFIIRYLKGIKKDWKIRFDGIDYDITEEPIDIDMEHRYLEIYCKVVS